MPETSCLFASFDTTLSGAFDAHISRLVSHDTQPRKDLTLASATGDKYKCILVASCHTTWILHSAHTHRTDIMYLDRARSL